MRRGGVSIYTSNDNHFGLPFVYSNSSWQKAQPYVYINNNWELAGQAGVLMLYFLTSIGDYFMTSNNEYFLVRER